MNLMTQKEFDLTVKNIVAACKNIEKLNSRGYNFLYLCSGFIAHYNINGFKDYYSQESLVDALIRNKECNQWVNFSKSDKNYDYYMQKREVYNRALSELSA